MPYIRTSEQTKSGTEARSGPERSLCACAVRSAFSSAIHSCFKALVRFRSFSCPAPQHKARARSIHRRRLWIHWPSAIKACSFFSTPLSFFFHVLFVSRAFLIASSSRFRSIFAFLFVGRRILCPSWFSLLSVFFSSFFVVAVVADAEIQFFKFRASTAGRCKFFAVAFAHFERYDVST